MSASDEALAASERRARLLARLLVVLAVLALVAGAIAVAAMVVPGWVR